jgi:hypothetical protein
LAPLCKGCAQRIEGVGAVVVVEENGARCCMATWNRSECATAGGAWMNGSGTGVTYSESECGRHRDVMNATGRGVWSCAGSSQICLEVEGRNVEGDEWMRQRQRHVWWGRA